MPKIKDFKTDYVYFDKKLNDYKNVHINLRIGKEHFLLTLYCDDMPEKADINELMNQLRCNIFKRLNASLKDECIIKMVVNKDAYDIIPYEDGVEIAKTKLED